MSSCSALIDKPIGKVQLDGYTGYYKSGVTEGEIKKTIMYLENNVSLKEGATLNFTLEKKSDAYHFLLDISEQDKLNLSDSPGALFMDLFGSLSKANESLSDDQMLKILLRSLAMGLTDDVLGDYTEVRVIDKSKGVYHTYPPSL